MSDVEGKCARILGILKQPSRNFTSLVHNCVAYVGEILQQGETEKSGAITDPNSIWDATETDGYLPNAKSKWKDGRLLGHAHIRPPRKCQVQMPTIIRSHMCLLAAGPALL